MKTWIYWNSFRNEIFTINDKCVMRDIRGSVQLNIHQVAEIIGIEEHVFIDTVE